MGTTLLPKHCAWRSTSNHRAHRQHDRTGCDHLNQSRAISGRCRVQLTLVWHAHRSKTTCRTGCPITPPPATQGDSTLACWPGCGPHLMVHASRERRLRKTEQCLGLDICLLLCPSFLVPAAWAASSSPARFGIWGTAASIQRPNCTISQADVRARHTHTGCNILKCPRMHQRTGVRRGLWHWVAGGEVWVHGRICTAAGGAQVHLDQQAVGRRLVAEHGLPPLGELLPPGGGLPLGRRR
jgi:hypothetical protein